MGFVMAELWRGGDAIDEAPADPFGRVAALGELVGTISSCYRRIAAQVAGRPIPPPDAFELSDPSALAGLLPDAKPSIRLADRLDGELAFQQAATVALTRSWRSPRETKLEAGMARLGMSTRDSTLQRWASALRFVTATPLPVAEATKQREKAEQEAKQIEEEERKRKQNDQQNPDGCAVDPEHLVNERNPARERDLLIIALHGTIYPADDARDLPDIDPATMLVLAAEKMRLSLASLINPLPPEQQLDPAPTGAPEHPMARIYPPRETFV